MQHPPTTERFAGRYLPLASLGQGAQGIAIRASDLLRQGSEVAIKVGLSGHETTDRIIAEFERLRSLDSPYITPVLDLGFASVHDLALLHISPSTNTPHATYPYLVSSWIQGTPLLPWIHQPHITAQDTAHLLAHLVQAVHELHRNGVLHGDLKPQHVLVPAPKDPDTPPKPTLIDFGLAVLDNPEHTTQPIGGTPGYIAPELFHGAPISKESDRFSLGVLLAQALTQTHTVPSSWAHGLSSNAPLATDDPLHSLPNRVSATLQRLLSRDPTRRPPLDLVYQTLLPPKAMVQGWKPPTRHRLPFLGAERAAWVHRETSKPTPPLRIIHGTRRSGKSRALRQARWELQSSGSHALELLTGTTPNARLNALGTQLAALSSKTFTPPPQDLKGDRARWTHTYAQSILRAAPETHISLFWDDIATTLDGGSSHAEIIALVLESTQGNINLWCTAETERLEEIQSIFSTLQHETYRLEPLCRDDLTPLFGQTFSSPTPLNAADLDHAFAQSQGNPGALHALLCTQPNLDPTRASWLTALAGLLPQGLSRNDVLRAATSLNISHTRALLLFDEAQAAGDLQPTPSLAALDETLWRARSTPLRTLPNTVQRQLAVALAPFTAQSGHLALIRAALAGDSEAAHRAWDTTQAQTLHTRATERTLYTLEVALSTLQDPDALDLYVETALDLGQPQHAHHVLQDIQPTDATLWAHTISIARARLLFAQGSYDDVLALAALSNPEHTTPQHRAWWTLLSAWIDLRRGAYQPALDKAQASVQDPALQREQYAALRADLWGCVGAAAAFLGEDHAEDALNTAHKALSHRDVPPRTRARYHAMRAIAATMRGALIEARDDYRTALEIVETHSLDADKPLYLLNLGTSYERKVQLSAALQYYQKGSRACLPSTRASTRALLLANCANVDVKLGRAHEAHELLDAAERIASQAGLSSVVRFVHHVRADAEASLGKYIESEEVYARCAREYDAHGDRRHACELYVKAGLIAVRRGGDPAVFLTEAQRDAADFPDLLPLLEILHSEREIRRGGLDAMHGLDRYTRALERALEQGDDLTVLTEAHPLATHIAQGPNAQDPLLTQELHSIAARAWRRVGLGLTNDLRTDLYTHLKLDTILPEHAPARTGVPWSPDIRSVGAGAPLSQPQTLTLPGAHNRALIRKFFRLLSIGRKILGEHDMQRLIPSALDIALELSEAERGFLFLRTAPSGPFEVAFSRDLDGQPIPRARLDVSRTIAQAVVEHGETVVTDHALADQRFAQAQSVLSLERTAILCTPIRDQDAVVGCLYLDRRHNQTPFHPDLVSMMRAFADQIALALVIAENVRALTEERDRLSKANARVGELLRDKEHLLLDLEERCTRLEADLERQQHHSPTLVGRYDHIIGQSAPMRAVIERIDRVAQVHIPVVLEGESGTGKELIASAIHEASPRRHGPCIAVNCGALTETLLESELFGHKKGAFTGASSDRRGLFQAAEGGTLFLDEIGEMSLAMQVKLLRALQERTIRPVGASREIPVDVRIVAATHRNLNEMVREGLFRQDLFYRVATLTLRLPALRERREDIPLLTRHFLERAAEAMGRSVPKVTGGAVEYLMSYTWPGNIRQMENTLRAALALHDGDLTRDVLASLLGTGDGRVQSQADGVGSLSEYRGVRVGRPPKRGRVEVEEALRIAGGDREEAALVLGVSTRTLQRYMKKFGL